MPVFIVKASSISSQSVKGIKNLIIKTVYQRSVSSIAQSMVASTSPVVKEGIVVIKDCGVSICNIIVSSDLTYRRIRRP